jgi:hypothetical protein
MFGVMRRTAMVVCAWMLVAFASPAGQAPVPQAPFRPAPALVESTTAGDRAFDFGPGAAASGATQVIADTRRRSAIPVLVTSMQRRRFDSRGTIVNSLEGFPDAMRRVARQEGVALIDLTARAVERIVSGRVSKVVVGPKSRQVFYLKDGAVYSTHLDTGATRLVVQNPFLRSGSGTTCRRRRAKCSGWQALTSPPVGARDTPWLAPTGPCISTFRRTARCSPATAVGRTAWPRPATASGSTSSRQARAV